MMPPLSKELQNDFLLKSFFNQAKGIIIFFSWGEVSKFLSIIFAIQPIKMLTKRCQIQHDRVSQPRVRRYLTVSKQV